MKKYDILGIGSPLLDFIVEVDDPFLKAIGLNKGEMHLVDEKKSKDIFEKIKNKHISIIPGGSAANTAAGVSFLGGRAAFHGKIGDDSHGAHYEKKNKEHGIDSKLAKHNTITGHAITFITPDGERTFAVNLGAAFHFTKEDLNEEDIKQSKILHVEGYLLEHEHQREAALHAMKIAKENNVKISIDLGDPALVKRAINHFKNIITKYADIVFANQAEAKVLTGINDEEKALHELSKMCKLAVVKLGERGSIIKHNGKVYRIESHKVKVVDTNGAGDMYAAGILYGIANELSIEESGNLASKHAAMVVSQRGARLKK